jgi:hypothetical protein
MARLPIAILAIASSLSINVSPASAQAPIAPVIVDLAVSAIRGLVMGVGQRAGQEIYDRAMRHSSSGSETQSGNLGPTIRTTAPSNPSELRAQIVPLQPPIPPDGLQWKFRNLHGGDIALQFYSATRRGYQWPAGSRAYLLTSAEPAMIRLRCLPGEKICYGGWAREGVAFRYWGTGYKLSHTCARCCRICGSEGSVAFR